MDTDKREQVTKDVRELIALMRDTAKNCVDHAELTYMVAWLLSSARDLELAIGDPID